MKKIKILHMYYDLLNLYGESGNILAITDNLDLHKISYTVDLKTIGDKININSYDIIYIGDGPINNINIVLNDIKKYQKDFKEYIESDKTLIVTGETINLFGKPYLNIFNFKSYEIEKEAYEVITECEFLNKPILGFINKSSNNDYQENNLFKEEGIKYKNFYGTYLIGPLLIRNPHLLDYILSNIIKDFKPITNTPDYQAYDEFIKRNQN